MGGEGRGRKREDEEGGGKEDLSSLSCKKESGASFPQGPQATHLIHRITVSDLVMDDKSHCSAGLCFLL